MELILAALLIPGLIFLLLGTGWLFGLSLSERVLGRMTACTYALSLLCILTYVYIQDSPVALLQMGNWFEFGDYQFPLVLCADRVSLTLMSLAALLTGLIGAFSRTYLHREPGYFRFFALLHLFGFASQLAFSAGTFDLLVAGWELVGVSSVLLIAFFYQREAPVINSIRVFATYRSADIGLLFGLFVLHHARHSTAILAAGQHELSSESATLVGLAFLLAAMGKAAQLPFSGWLPRAMEGPTPSSAIFYGAISVHMGVYLLLRARPFLADAPLALAAVVTIGLLTAIQAFFAGRVASDAKGSLAWGAVVQLGLIVAEIGMGWTDLALLHMVGHSAMRTLQFLRAPSMLHEYHHLHAASGGGGLGGDWSIESWLPEPLRLKLYWFALDRGHLDHLLDQFLILPLHKLSSTLGRLLSWPASSEANPHPAKPLKEVDADVQ
jgi:NADH-quinone oxidoreductase subunit L